MPPKSSVSPQYFVEAAVMGPGGGRQATADELESIRERAEQRRDRHDAALEHARSRWSRQALICAHELLDRGTTVLSADRGKVRGHLVRFWRGDNVLELSSVSRDGGGFGSSMTRLSRRLNHTRADVIATCLLHELAYTEGRPE